MSLIRQEDLIQAIADAFQYISYYHPPDFIRAMSEAYEQEVNPSAKDAIAQILTNSLLCAQGKRPICQDTGICVVFINIGMNVRWDGARTIQQMVDEGVRRAYLDSENPLRASILRDPLGTRKNTGDNTPAVVHLDMIAGDEIEVLCGAKGGGSENKAKLAMLNPSDSLVDWVVETVPKMGAGWCPPGILGIGVGGTPEKAVVLAKKAMMQPVDLHELRRRGPSNRIEELRLEIFERVNALGIGAQGLGGLSTVLDVKILDTPTHAASLPVGMIPNCAATRHIHFTMDGSGPLRLKPPPLDSWPKIFWQPTDNARRVNLDTLTPEEVANWQPGQTLLLTGRMLTGRDAAHKRMVDMLSKGETLPVDLRGRALYYVGPVDAVRDEAVGPAGPTTATRMDKFTDIILSKTGLLVMIGKAERGPQAVDIIRKHRAAYLIAVGGAAYLVSKAIKKSRIVAFADLGMEAIHEFIVEDMPVTVAVDSRGISVHTTGPQQWQPQAIQFYKNHPVIKHAAP